jgi:hypothetical protein
MLMLPFFFKLLTSVTVIDNCTEGSLQHGKHDIHPGSGCSSNNGLNKKSCFQIS